MVRSMVHAVIAIISLLLPMATMAQTGYSPGQTFSSSQRATPTPVPYRRAYNPRNQAYRQPVQPRQAVRQQRAPAQRPGAPSLYNMQPSAPTGQPAPAVRRERKLTVRDSDKEKKSTVRKSDNTEKKETVHKKVSSKSDNSKSDNSEKKAEEAKKVAETAKADETGKVESTDKLVFFDRRTGKKWIALTYDDGPNITLTPELTKYLVENHVPATFFLLGEMVKTHPELVKALADDGFELANHTWDHPDLRKKSSEEIRSQLQRTHDLIKKASGGIDVKMMRPPYGAHNSKVDNICKEMGYKIILWDVDTEDWKKRPTNEIVDRITKEAHDGSIILMHDRKHGGKKTSLEATKRVVKMYRDKGYTFVTVGRLIDLAGESAPAHIGTPAPVPTATPASLSTPVPEISHEATSSGLTGTAPLPTPATATPAPILP